MYGYSGPVTSMVMNRWMMTRYLWHAMMANHGCLIFVMDHRYSLSPAPLLSHPSSGIGGRGRLFAQHAYGDISRFAVSDQLLGAAYLQTLPYVDANRMGFWGWSGGGYLAWFVPPLPLPVFCSLTASAT